jgi:hypothetical protein
MDVLGLLELAGSQWDRQVTMAVIEVAGTLVDATPMLDGVGRGAGGCGCSDASPDAVRDLLDVSP